MKRYKSKTVGRVTYIQKFRKDSLFEPDWETIASFVGCRSKCAEIVNLLNQCDTHSNKQKK